MNGLTGYSEGHWLPKSWIHCESTINMCLNKDLDLVTWTRSNKRIYMLRSWMTCSRLAAYFLYMSNSFQYDEDEVYIWVITSEIVNFRWRRWRKFSEHKATSYIYKCRTIGRLEERVQRNTETLKEHARSACQEIQPGYKSNTGES